MVDKSQKRSKDTLTYSLLVLHDVEGKFRPSFSSSKSSVVAEAEHDDGF